METLILTQYKQKQIDLKYCLTKIGFKVDLKEYNDEIKLDEYNLLILNDIYPYFNSLGNKINSLKFKYKFGEKIYDYIKEEKIIIGLNDGFLILLNNKLILDEYNLIKTNFNNWIICDVVGKNKFINIKNIMCPIYYNYSVKISDKYKEYILFRYKNYILGLQNKKQNIIGSFLSIDKCFYNYNNPYWQIIKDKLPKYGVSWQIFNNIFKYIKHKFR